MQKNVKKKKGGGALKLQNYNVHIVCTPRKNLLADVTCEKGNKLLLLSIRTLLKENSHISKCM